MSDHAPFIVGLGGTLRPESSSEKLMKLALTAAARAGAVVECIGGRELLMPIFDPTAGDRTEESIRLIEKIRRCDGLIIASPGYHGSISGLVKNAIDYVEDLKEDDRVYLDGRAVGCIACGNGWQAASATLSALRSVVHALRGWPTPMGVVVNTSQPAFNEAGELLDQRVHQQLQTMGRQIVDFAVTRGSKVAGKSLAACA